MQPTEYRTGETMSPNKTRSENLLNYLSNFMPTYLTMRQRATSWDAAQDGDKLTDEQIDSVVTETMEPEESYIGRLNYEQLLKLRLTLNDRLTAIEKACEAHLVHNPKLEGWGGFKWKKGNKKREIQQLAGLITLLADKGVAKKELYTVTLLGVPAIEKIMKAKLTEGEFEEAYEKYIKETPGKKSLNYVGSF